MSKSRRSRGAEGSKQPDTGRPVISRDPAASSSNQALLAAMGATRDNDQNPGAYDDPLVRTAAWVVHAIRLAPPGPERTARFVDLIERSQLSAAQCDALVVRLQRLQDAGDKVSEALIAHLGADGSDVRAQLTAALATGVLAVTLGQDPEQAVAAAVAGRTGHSVDAVQGVVAALAPLGASFWEEEEEEGLVGEVATGTP